MLRRTKRAKNEVAAPEEEGEEDYYYYYFNHSSILRRYIYVHICVCVCVCVYTGCLRRKGPNFGRVFLRSNYTDITQNTYIQISMVTEILAREKCGLLVSAYCILSVTSYSGWTSSTSAAFLRYR
jgi:hypothetical protein